MRGLPTKGKSRIEADTFKSTMQGKVFKEEEQFGALRCIAKKGSAANVAVILKQVLIYFYLLNSKVGAVNCRPSLRIHRASCINDRDD